MPRGWSKRGRAHRDLLVDRGSPQRGRDIRQLKRAIRKRAKGRGLPLVKVDGVYTRRTDRVARRVAEALGVAPATLARQDGQGRRVLTVGAQRVIRYPWLRGPRQLARARRWQRQQREHTARQRAVRWAIRQARAGVVEQPAGSNRGGRITGWQRELGEWLIGLPWCGVLCAAALRHAGVKGVTYRLASVANIEDDAKAGRAPFRSWTTDASQVRPGDLVVWFGRGIHVEIVVRVDRKRGVVHTVGGNTSAGDVGSQSNGGGVFRRTRPLSQAHGFALVDYSG